jgi:hypothetical protein
MLAHLDSRPSKQRQKVATVGLSTDSPISVDIYLKLSRPLSQRLGWQRRQRRHFGEAS